MDYENLDWQRTDKELATETGRSVPTINRKRHQLGHSTRSTNKIEQWRSLNWHRTNAEIADQMGVNEKTAAVMRVYHSNGVKAVRKLGRVQAIKQAAEELREKYRHAAQDLMRLIAAAGTETQKLAATSIWQERIGSND